MRVTIVLTAAMLVVAGCADPVAPTRATGPVSSTAAAETNYQRFLRERESQPRGASPFSVPPETPGAPLSATVQAEPPAPATAPPAQAAPAMAEARLPSASLDPAAAPNPTAAPLPPQGDAPAEAAASDAPHDERPMPSFGVPEIGPEVQVVRVDGEATGAEDGPNIVAFALSTTHPVGTQRYTRRNPLRWQLWERNCLQFADQSAAQEAFLAAGGPENDRHNLDPDGDGFACWWDPEPIRRVARAAAD